MNYSKQRATWWSGICYHKQQFDELINSSDIRGYAYILHDKDVNETGKPKAPHDHFLVQLLRQQRGAWFSQFSTDELGEVFYRPAYGPQCAYEYLIHNTPASKKKYQYDPAERISTLESIEAEEKEDDKKVDSLKQNDSRRKQSASGNYPQLQLD